MIDYADAGADIIAVYQRQHERALARMAEVDAKADVQAWEVKQARESLATARMCLDVHGAAFAMAGRSR